jgi:hypothetical protein
MSIFKASWVFHVQLALLLPVSVGLSGCQFPEAEPSYLAELSGAAEWMVESLNERVGVTAVERRQRNDFLFFELTAGVNAVAEEVADTLWLLLDIGETVRAGGAGERKMKLPYPIRSAEAMADAGRGAGVSSGMERSRRRDRQDRLFEGDGDWHIVAQSGAGERPT